MLQNIASRSSAVKAAILTGLMTAVAAAHAEIPAAVGTAFAGIKTDADSLFAMVIPYVVGVLGLMVVIKLIKRFGNKI